MHTVIYTMGDEADDILSSYALVEADRKKYATVCDKFNRYFVKGKNIQSHPNWRFKRSVPPRKQQSKLSCSRCGKSPVHGRQQCPARDVTCHRCSKVGNFQIVCRSNTQEVEVDEEEEEPAFMGVVQDCEHSNPWVVTCG